MVETDFAFRWLIRRDVFSVLSMLSIKESDLVAVLRKSNCIGIVLEDQRTLEIVGVVIYELHKQEINIVFFGYDHNFTGNFFPAMVQRMTDKQID